MLSRQKVGTALIIAAVVLFLVGGLVLVFLVRTGGGPRITIPAPTLTATAEGAVNTPGSYALPTDSSVGDLVQAAGGFTTIADTNALDLMRLVQDGEVVTITARCLNINTATIEQFDSLPGIGPTRAADIVAYRTINGDFQTVDDLQQVRGIGPTTLASIMAADCIRVGN